MVLFDITSQTWEVVDSHPHKSRDIDTEIYNADLLSECWGH